MKKEEEQRKKSQNKKDKREVKDAAMHSDPSEFSEHRGRPSQVSQVYS